MSRPYDVKFIISQNKGIHTVRVTSSGKSIAETDPHWVWIRKTLKRYLDKAMAEKDDKGFFKTKEVLEESISTTLGKRAVRSSRSTRWTTDPVNITAEITVSEPPPEPIDTSRDQSSRSFTSADYNISFSILQSAQTSIGYRVRASSDKSDISRSKTWGRVCETIRKDLIDPKNAKITTDKLQTLISTVWAPEIMKHYDGSRWVPPKSFTAKIDGRD